MAEGRPPLIGKGTRPEQRRNRGRIFNRRQWPTLLCTPRFHPTPSHPPLPGTGILAFIHTNYGHPGVAQTTELTQRKYHWTSLKSNVRDYVLSCGCRRLKRSIGQRVAMLPAGFLQPWEVLEMDIHDMGARSEAGNRHLLVIVVRDRKFLFACPLPSKTA